MTSAPKVSVVIPAYNAMRYLPQTVRSVLEQTFKDFELLIVDDGSTDDFCDWAGRLSDKRIRVLQQKNLGAGAARNAGLLKARGRYVAFLDADDIWLPTKLEKQVADLEARPEVGLTHTSISYIDAQGNKFRKDLKAHGRGDVWRHIVSFNPYYLVHCGSTPLIRRECFDVVGTFNTELKFSQDWEMWIRIARRYDFSVIQEPLVLYRRHGQNMSKSYVSALSSFHKIIESTFSAAEPSYAHLKRQAYGRTYLLIAWRAYRAKDYQAAYTLQLQSLKAFPKLLFVKNSIHLSLRLTAHKLMAITALLRPET